MPNNNIRTRFAPSPTGYMHVGNLRTALYTYLMAKHDDGTFILRIEDTDQGRYVEGAVDVIYNTLRETGLLWDEGPDIGGPVGPYVQSERMGMFKQYAEQLVAEGKVAIPANKHHTCLNPEGIGSMLRTKINVNLGVSRDCKDYNLSLIHI